MTRGSRSSRGLRSLRAGARGAGLLSLVTLAAACSLRPFTPSVSVAYATQEVPFPKVMAVPSAREVSARWELAPGDPWARYEKSTLVASLDAMGGRAELPDVLELDVLTEAVRAARRLGEVGLPSGTLWIADMRGAASIAFGAALPRHTKEPISPVLTFANWPSETGLVPADETLAALVLMGPPRPPRETANANANARSHPVFLLDSWRLAYRDDDPGDAYDNRYMLQPHDLPSADELRQRGITRVVYLVESFDDTEGEEDDLHPVLRAWQASGVSIHLVDLAFLSGLGAAVDWERTLRPATLWVERRVVLQDDPMFYARARGGFGFAYGHPLFFPGGFSRSRGGYSGGSGFGGG